MLIYTTFYVSFLPFPPLPDFNNCKQPNIAQQIRGNVFNLFCNVKNEYTSQSNE